MFPTLINIFSVLLFMVNYNAAAMSYKFNGNVNRFILRIKKLANVNWTQTKCNKINNKIYSF